MRRSPAVTVRFAIYTRKSSDEGLEQEFNSLDAQRLSFAQFERDIAGERIRDKIAASKRKGMWMGGNVPLGYGTALGLAARGRARPAGYCEQAP